MKYDIPLEYFHKRLQYDEDSGRLIWKNGQRKGHQAGSIVENISGNQYRFMSLGYKGKTYNFMAHRVIWFMQTGEWPEDIDHRDGEGLNNAFTNLRSVTRTVNNMNHRKQKNNSSGLAGVSFRAHRGKWWAYGDIGKSRVQLAYTLDLFEAACARKSWELRNDFTERHGR
jgi:hypothetical protein